MDILEDAEKAIASRGLASIPKLGMWKMEGQNDVVVVRFKYPEQAQKFVRLAREHTVSEVQPCNIGRSGKTIKNYTKVLFSPYVLNFSQAIETEELPGNHVDGYSLLVTYTREEWSRIGEWIRKELCWHEVDVELILRSKHMRLASDYSGKQGCNTTLEDFKKYLGTTLGLTEIVRTLRSAAGMLYGSEHIKLIKEGKI